VENHGTEATIRSLIGIFFDCHIQQKESFSPYVFEDLALEILHEKLKKSKTQFGMKRKWNRYLFQVTGYAQLELDIQKQSKYYETEHMQYPIYRILKDYSINLQTEILMYCIGIFQGFLIFPGLSISFSIPFTWPRLTNPLLKILFHGKPNSLLLIYNPPFLFLRRLIGFL